MKFIRLDQETVLELGLVVFATGLVTGLVTLIYGRATGGVKRSRRHHQMPPQPGSVSSERHRNISTVAAR